MTRNIKNSDASDTQLIANVKLKATTPNKPQN